MNRRLPSPCLPLVLLVVCVPSHAGDWPQFLGPQRNGHAVGEAIVGQIDPQDAKILWRVPAGAGYSGPVVAGGKVVVFHQPSDQEVLECLEASTGQSLWKVGYACDYGGGYGTGPGPRGTPCIADGVVYSFGATATLQAVELATGKLLWRRELQKEFAVPEGFFGVGTSPMVDNGRLLVTVGAKTASLVAFDGKTGTIVWNASDDAASYASPTMAPFDGRPLLLFFARTGLHLVDPHEGRVLDFFRWRARINASVNAATPIVVGDRVFVSAEYGTGAAQLRVADGRFQQVWTSQESMSNHYNTCVYHEGHLYGIDGRQEFGARLRCVDWDNGEPLWTQEGFGCAALVLVSGKLLMWTENGEIVLADAVPTGYRERGRMTIGRPESRAYPALSGGHFFVRTPDEFVAVKLNP